MCSVVQEEDSENAVVNHCAYEVCDTVHQRLQVESGVQCIREAVEEKHLQRFDTRKGIGLGCDRRPVVALEGMR